MSRTSRIFDCTPDEVFDVLADGWAYPLWVVGASRIRDVDAGWPDPGARIHHSVGLWPLLVDDTSEVLEVSRPHHLRLRVRAWPSGEGEVLISCLPNGAGTEVVIEERAVDGPAALIPTPVQDALLHLRNVEALRRLAYLAENRRNDGRRPGDGTAGPVS